MSNLIVMHIKKFYLLIILIIYESFSVLQELISILVYIVSKKRCVSFFTIVLLPDGMTNLSYK
jgi:hypothetical protein